MDERVLLKKLNLKSVKPQSTELEVSSTDRAFGTIFGSEVTRVHGTSLKEDTYTIRATGGGGQSFGAFIPKGVTIRLDRRQQRLFRQGPVRRQTGGPSPGKRPLPGG